MICLQRPQCCLAPHPRAFYSKYYACAVDPFWDISLDLPTASPVLLGTAPQSISLQVLCMRSRSFQGHFPGSVHCVPSSLIILNFPHMGSNDLALLRIACNASPSRSTWAQPYGKAQFCSLIIFPRMRSTVMFYTLARTANSGSHSRSTWAQPYGNAQFGNFSRRRNNGTLARTAYSGSPSRSTWAQRPRSAAPAATPTRSQPNSSPCRSCLWSPASISRGHCEH